MRDRQGADGFLCRAVTINFLSLLVCPKKINYLSTPLLRPQPTFEMQLEKTLCTFIQRASFSQQLPFFALVRMPLKISPIPLRRCCVSDQQPKYYSEKKG